MAQQCGRRAAITSHSTYKKGLCSLGENAVRGSFRKAPSSVSRSPIAPSDSLARANSTNHFRSRRLPPLVKVSTAAQILKSARRDFKTPSRKDEPTGSHADAIIGGPKSFASARIGRMESTEAESIEAARMPSIRRKLYRNLKGDD